jgi:hypothetical protein
MCAWPISPIADALKLPSRIVHCFPCQQRVGTHRERSDAISGNNQASSATVIAMYTHWRLVLGGTRNRYGPTTAAAVNMRNQKVGDLAYSTMTVPGGGSERSLLGRFQLSTGRLRFSGQGVTRQIGVSADLRITGPVLDDGCKAPLGWRGSTHNTISNQFERIGARRRCREILLGACAADADVWAARDEWLKGPPVASSHPIWNSDRFNIVGLTVATRVGAQPSRL